MLLTLYDQRGNEKATLQANESSTQDKEVQGDNVLSLGFTLYAFVPIDVNDYVEFCGERYWALEKYLPTEKSSVEWEYNVQLYGIESLVKRFLVLNTTDGENEAVFTLTAPPVDHLRLIVESINAGMGTTDWKVGRVEGTDNVVINYEGKYCDEALKELAEAVGVEWWIEGETVNLCRCEWGEAVVLGYGEGLTGLEQDRADNAKFYTRLFPIGSSRNIDRERYGTSRLQLPGGAKYVDQTDLVQKYGVIHNYEQETFSGIYPRRVGEVSSVRSKEVQDSDGKPYTVYYFKDDGLTFDPNAYEIGGLVKRVSFQEGSELAGLGADNDHYFEVNFDSETREFEIITIWPYDDDRQLPGDTLVPKEGDKYILWNIRMPDEYYTLAEAEYLSAVEEYNRKHTQDVSRYKGGTDHVWIEESGTELEVGRRVRLKSTEYFPGLGYRDSRITRISRKVNLPSQMDLEIGDALSSGRLEKIDDAISDARSYAGSILGAVNVPDVIRSWDKTTPTDNNIYSARRTHKEFLSKRDDDVAQGLLGFVKGLWVKAKGLFGIDEQGDARLRNVTMQGDVVSDNFQSGWDGSGYALIKDADGVSRLEVDDLMIRRKLMAREVDIQRETYIGGLFSIGDADGTIYKMTPFDGNGERMNVTVYVIGGIAIGVNTNTNEVIGLDKTEGTAAFYRCYFVRSDDETKVKNRWKVGDMARCDEWDLVKRNGEGDDANPIGNRFYWRLVINTGTEMILDADGVEREYAFIDLAARYVTSANECLFAWPMVNGDYIITFDSEPPGPILNAPLRPWPSAANSDIPAVGDHVVQNGSICFAARQSIIKIGYNGSTNKTKELNVFENIGATLTSAATQYSYPSNPVKIGSAGTSITSDKIFLKTSGGVSPVERYGGGWLDDGTQTANEGELWTYNGQLWRCNTDGTTATPSGTSSAWSLYVQKGEKGDKGDKGDKGNDGTSFVPKGTAVGVFDDPAGGQAFEDYVGHYGSLLANGVWLILDRAEAYRVLDGSATQITDITDSDFYIVQVDESEPYGTLTNIVGHAFYHQSDEWKDVGKMTGKDGKDGANGADGADGLSFEVVPAALVLTETFAGWKMENGEYVLDQNNDRIPTYSYDLPQTVRVRALYGGAYDSKNVVDIYGVTQSVANGLNVATRRSSQVNNEFDVVISAGDAIGGDWTLDVISISVDPPVGSETVIHIPVQVNRAGKSYVALANGVAALVVELDKKIDNAVTVTGKGITVGTMMEDLLKAGLDYEIDKSASASDETLWKYILKFLGNRFEFRDPTDVQSGVAQLRMFISNGLLNVVNPLTGNTQIEFGLDENNNAVLKYYDAQGNYLYNLGPDGLQMLGSQALGMRTRRMGGVSYENIVADVYRNDPHIILKCVAWACADDLQTIVKSSCYEMQFKEAAGVYVLVSAHQAQQVEITDYDHNTTYQETITPEYDITKENGELYDHKWLDSQISTPQQVIGVMGSSGSGIQEHLLRSEGAVAFRNVFVDDSFDVYHGEGIPSDYIPSSQDATMIIYCKDGVERNYTEVNFSQTVYVRRLRYFREGLEVDHLDIYFNM